MIAKPPSPTVARNGQTQPLAALVLERARLRSRPTAERRAACSIRVPEPWAAIAKYPRPFEFRFRRRYGLRPPERGSRSPRPLQPDDSFGGTVAAGCAGSHRKPPAGLHLDNAARSSTLEVPGHPAGLRAGQPGDIGVEGNDRDDPSDHGARRRGGTARLVRGRGDRVGRPAGLRPERVHLRPQHADQPDPGDGRRHRRPAGVQPVRVAALRVAVQARDVRHGCEPAQLPGRLLHDGGGPRAVAERCRHQRVRLCTQPVRSAASASR